MSRKQITSQTKTLQRHGEGTKSERLLAIVDRDEYVFASDEIQSLTIATAQDSKQFSLIKKEMGEKYLQACISKILKEALKFLPSKMGTEDIIYFSKFFQKQLWHWKFDDFILCLKKGIAKEYGDIYGDFNISVFMKWADAYEKEKEAHFYDIHLSNTEKNNVTEANKHEIYKARQGRVNDVVSIRDYLGGKNIPDERYFNNHPNQ